MDSSNKGATDAPKNAMEVRERADKSGIYTKPPGAEGPGGTGASGATSMTGGSVKAGRGTQ